MRRLPRLLPFGLACVLTIWLPLPASPAEGKSEEVRGAASPEEAFAGFREAAAKQDWATAFKFMMPESRDLVVGGMLAGAHMGALGEDGKALAARTADPAKLDQLIAAVEKAGREEQASAIGKIAALVEDKPAFMKEALRLFREQKQENVLNELGQARLERLRVEGEAATAHIRITTETGSGSEDCAFRKVDGQWFVDYRG